MIKDYMPTKKQDAERGELYISKKFDPKKYYNCFNYYNVADITKVWTYAYAEDDILQDDNGNYYKVKLKRNW